MASTETTIEARPRGQPASPASDAGGAGDARRMLLFEVGGRLYGCGIDVLREIIPFRACTRLPGAPSFVCGLINLRGTITTVLDLARRLDVGEVDRAEGSIVLVEHGAKTVGVGVDRVLDVQAVVASAIEPATGDEARGGIAEGLVHLDGNVVVLLDVRQLVKQVLL